MLLLYMSQSSWKQTNSRDKTFTLGLNTSITAKDITTSGKLEVNTMKANEFTGSGVVDSSASLGGVTSASGEMIATANAIKKYVEGKAGNINNQNWTIFSSGDVSYLYPTKENIVIAARHTNPPNGTLHFVSDVSFDKSIAAVDASFEKIGGLNGTPLDIGDVSFSGSIGHTYGVGNALEVTTDLSVNGDFRVSDASFARVGELVPGSKVVFVSDVSFDGSIRALDASFEKIGGLNGTPLDIGDVSFSGSIGHTDGVGKALEVTTDLSVNGDFRVSDASFARVGELVPGSKVVFVSDVSFDKTVVVGNSLTTNNLTVNGTMYYKDVFYTFTEHTFTPCDNSGNIGPELLDCKNDASYQLQSWTQSLLFFNMEYRTGGIQEWIVPKSARYIIEANGADARNSYGGFGASISGIFDLTYGESIFILCGQQPSPYTTQNRSGAGGTYVVRNKSGDRGQTISGDILMIAGGGGGGNGSSQNHPDANANLSEIGYLNADPQLQSSGAGFSKNGGGGETTSSGNQYMSESFINGGLGGYDTRTSTNPNTDFQGGFGGGGLFYSNHSNIGGGGGFTGGGVSSSYGGGGGSIKNGLLGYNSSSIRTVPGSGSVKISEKFDIPPPAFTNSPSPLIAANALFSYTPNAVNVLLGDEVILTITSKPDWLNWDGATISGTPTDKSNSSYVFTIRASDARFATSKEFTIEVVSEPSINNNPNDGDSNTGFQWIIGVINGSAGGTNISMITTPTGLTLDANTNTLSGSYQSSPGTQDIRINLTDSFYNDTDVSGFLLDFSYQVLVPIAPSFDTTNNNPVNGIYGTSFSWVPSYNNGTYTATLALVSITPSYSGIALSSDGKTLSGTYPNDGSQYTIKMSLTDSYYTGSNAIERDFTFDLITPTAPSFNTTNNPVNGIYGTSFSWAPSYNNGTFTATLALVSITPSYSGIALSSDGTTLSGTYPTDPDDGSQYTIKMSLTDSYYTGSNSIESEFTFDLINPSPPSFNTNNSQILPVIADNILFWSADTNWTLPQLNWTPSYNEGDVTGNDLTLSVKRVEISTTNPAVYTTHSGHNLTVSSSSGAVTGSITTSANGAFKIVMELDDGYQQIIGESMFLITEAKLAFRGVKNVNNWIVGYQNWGYETQSAYKTIIMDNNGPDGQNLTIVVDTEAPNYDYLPWGISISGDQFTGTHTDDRDPRPSTYPGNHVGHNTVYFKFVLKATRDDYNGYVYSQEFDYNVYDWISGGDPPT